MNREDETAQRRRLERNPRRAGKLTKSKSLITYTVKKIIDDVKIEKKKMGEDYETWLMIVIGKKNGDGYEAIGDDNGFDVTMVTVIAAMVIIASAVVVIMVGAATNRDGDDYRSIIAMEVSMVVMVKRR
ncbi:hypothetical protein F2Q69_00059908 [Brassica cretica]|uniref:Uncharacterized protein n=1 Tax=Brassica cretica TaxID=69181 RepID=A0A8S9RQI0_BRACR|nr:hypothetical protein F2Q69_00059908 [Brassica cretica]